MKKGFAVATILGLGISLFSASGTYAKSTEAYKEVMLSVPGEISTQAGTLIGMQTEAYSFNGTVNAYGTTTTSQAVPDIRVANYLYENSKAVRSKLDRRTNSVTAYAFSGSIAYTSGRSYYSASDHFVIDPYGQTYADRTIDSDL